MINWMVEKGDVSHHFNLIELDKKEMPLIFTNISLDKCISFFCL